MNSIAVSKTCGIEDCTVAIENSRTDNYFLFAVLINVSSHTVVISVAVAENRLVRTGIPFPVEFEFLVLDLICGHCGSFVIASSEAGIRSNTIEISNAACKAVAAVAPCVAP